MCFNGLPEYIIVDTDRFQGYKRNTYDLDWNFREDVLMGFSQDTPMKKPEELVELLEYARKLSKEFHHARVDFYVINGKIYFGEITFTNGADFDKIKPFEFVLEMGSLLKVNKTSSIEQYVYYLLIYTE